VIGGGSLAGLRGTALNGGSAASRGVVARFGLAPLSRITRGNTETGGAIAALSGAAGNAATTSVRETVGGVKAGADANCSVGRTAGCGATTGGGVTIGAAFTS
jgi:hypothetical protein